MMLSVIRLCMEIGTDLRRLGLGAEARYCIQPKITRVVDEA